MRVLVLVVAFWICSKCLAQELTIGVPFEEQAINIVKSEHPFAKIILSAVTQPLFKVDPSKAAGVELVMADTFSSSADGKSLELRIRSSASFANQERVSEIDLKSSLDRCAKLAVDSPNFEVQNRKQRLFVVFKDELGKAKITGFVERCPILQEQSLRLFGEDLGTANLVLGTGPFQLVSRIKNREARLERTAHSRSWAQAINVRGFTDDGHALTALRSGTIDAFYTRDSEIETKAQKDTTLRVASCGVYNVILRRGLEFSCSPSLDPGAIKYAAL